MRDSNPEINKNSFVTPLRRNLTIAEISLLIIGVIIFAGGMLFLGPLKFALAMTFLVIVAVTFFSPKYGLYILYGAEGLYILVFYVNLMALAPTQLGLDYTISFYFEGGALLIAPLMVLFVAYLMGFLARTWISKEKYVLTPFEGTLLAFLFFCTAWTAISVANELYALTILTDLHVVLIFAFGIFIARTFSKIEEFRTLFNFFIIISLAHWVILTGYFIQQRLYTELLFLLDLIRAIQGSSDIYSPFIPLMLAMMAINGNKKHTKLEKYYPMIIFLFSIRTILSLSRGAMAQVIFSIIAVFLLMPTEYRKAYLGEVKRQLVYAAIFCVLIFIASPSMAKIGFKLVASRATESGSSGAVKQGSLKYRTLETQMVLENIAESPIIGFGPGKQTAKRMFTYVSASEEPYVHNGFLWYVLKFGLIGLAFLGFVLARYFISLNRLIRGSPPLQKAMLIGSAAALIGILPIVITNNVIAAVQGNFFVSFIFGLLIFAERKNMASNQNDGATENASA